MDPVRFDQDKLTLSDSESLSNPKSNTVVGEIVFKWACQKSVNFGDKNEDISESVCSFDFGAIFQTSLGHKLSRNAFVVSILFPERNSYWRKGSEHDTGKSKNA